MTNTIMVCLMFSLKIEENFSSRKVKFYSIMVENGCEKTRLLC